jgi:N-dimethylarginine dimethylaminohydrolase
LALADDVVVADLSSIRSGTLLDAGGERPLDVSGMLRDPGMRIINVTPERHTRRVGGRTGLQLRVPGGAEAGVLRPLDRVYELMLRRDLEIYRTPGSELVKGRGGPRCMTRPIYRRGL